MSTGCGDPGSVPGTLGCEVPGLYDYESHVSSDCDVLGGLGSFGLRYGPLILLQQVSGGICKEGHLGEA